jgi:hypothetical protein
MREQISHPTAVDQAVEHQELTMPTREHPAPAGKATTEVEATLEYLKEPKVMRVPVAADPEQ